MPDTPNFLPATELVDRFRRKTLSPVEVTKACLARIDALQEKLNAFIVIDHEGALAAARESEARWMNGDPRGMVDGVPVTIKDIIATKKWPTGRGSKTAPMVADADAPAVARLTEQGAVTLGKTTTPEFGWKGLCDSPLSGITRNPWNPEMTPGGSSGGAAVAAACGMGALHIGTDGGGSVRIPAAFTGVFGHKPSYGRVPAYPPSAMGTLAHLGPLTRTVEDAALMLTVMSGPDDRDSTALPHVTRDYRIGINDGVRSLRIGYSADLGHAMVDAEIAECVAAAAQSFEDLGATVEQVGLDLSETTRLFRIHWYAGAARILAHIAPEERELVEEGLREVAAEGATYDAITYLDAMNERTVLGAKMNAYHREYDLLLTPSLAVPAFIAGAEMPDPVGQERWTDWTPFTYPFNLTQQPAASIPCGFTKSGLPIGLQVVGPMHADALVLRACRAFESRNPIILPEV